MIKHRRAENPERGGGLDESLRSFTSPATVVSNPPVRSGSPGKSATCVCRKFVLLKERLAKDQRSILRDGK